jgi:beta-phosphoglucomutase-like phosphatase (HAD superfamily)
VKKYMLFDHDGVLVDTGFWYYKAGERALAFPKAERDLRPGAAR